MFNVIKSYRQKQIIKRQQKLYHNPAYVPPAPKEKTSECPECGRIFRHKGNLIRHMTLHDPESTAQEKAMALKIGSNNLTMKLFDRSFISSKKDKSNIDIIKFSIRVM